ncbi:MAG: CoA transferase [Dehalococcoidia bacterium]|nr:CoA transferase [Dehalococcoidia bacterium]
MSSGNRPLAGLRVLSLAQQLPGPYCGLLLADLGAEVILVEQIPAGDPARVFPGLFTVVNRSKRSVALDLKQPAGLEAFNKLAATAQIVLEGFRPGVAKRLGIDYEAVKAVRPDVIYCSISGYGQTGPARLLPGHDLSYQARAGAIPLEAGSRSSLPIADFSSAMFAAVSVLGALSQRALGGGPGPRYIDVSMTESVLSWNAIQVGRAMAGEAGADEGGEPAYGVFATADGRLTLSIAHEDHFWQALCACFQNDGFARLRGAERRSRAAELGLWVREQLVTRSTAEWLSLFQQAGVPAGPVNLPAETLADEQFVARATFFEIDGQVHIRPPWRFEGDALVEEPAPTVGQHTRLYLREVGYTDAAIGSLVERGAAKVV